MATVIATTMPRTVIEVNVFNKLLSVITIVFGERTLIEKKKSVC